MTDKKIFPFVLFIIVVISLGQMSSDIYLPSLPIIAHALNAPIHLAQFTISSYLFGFGISQIFYGVLSDAIGRKKTLLIGLIIFMLGLIICLFSDNIFVLIVARFIQGIGAASAAVIARATIRDSVKVDKLAAYISYFTVAGGVVVASAPLVGGYIQHFFDWRANFVFLTIYAGLVLFYCVVYMSETNKYSNITNIKFTKMMQNIRSLLNTRNIVYMFLGFIGYGSILLWLTFCPVMMRNKFHILPYQFGWIAFFGGVMYIIGGVVNGKLVNRKIGINKMILIGATILSCAGVLLYVSFLFTSIYSVILPLMLSMLGISMILPNVLSGALLPVPHLAGLMTSMIGTVQLLGGFASTACISLFANNNQLPLADVFTIYGLFSLLLVVFVILQDSFLQKKLPFKKNNNKQYED